MPPAPAAAVKRGIRAGIRAAAMVADGRLGAGDGITVLGYHQVGGPVAGSVNLPLPLFEAQAAWLAEHAHVVSLDDAVARLTGDDKATAPLPTDRPTVAITFDDGTADFVEHAVPVLARHGLPVTLYLATSFVEEGRSFWDDGTVLSWSALADALATGVVAVGSHTHTHVLLDRTPPDRIAEELDTSIQLIADRLGVEARHFAYPKAIGRGAAGDRAVRARFASAAVAGGGTNRPGRTDVHHLARQPVLVADGLRWFERKARGGLALEGRLRDRLDQRRYAGAER